MQLNFAPAVALLAAVSPALASSPLVPQLQQLTQGISNTREIFNDLKIYTTPRQGPNGITTYKNEIIKAKESYIENTPSMVEEADQASVCENFVNFVTVSQDLMNTLIEKHALFGATTLSAPVSHLIRMDEYYTDTFVYNIEGLVPSCASQIADSKKKLLEAYELATDAYM
ncbi:hypothetical protein N7533_007866 [Penicillium manginii]|uniref:uncharacterized protein n=1 Tax=Penicillium manginii TaxID=203109 RepID=UPI0025474F3D|nr:uncharacterized protein N7533_007866 [Penicillium manginii]KAJ5750838.1 hypothetical protein N7533_007866 [Penicillium manginii]